MGTRSSGSVLGCFLSGNCGAFRLISIHDACITDKMQAIYLVLGRMAFQVGINELKGEEPWHAILARHVSYFGGLDTDSLESLMHHFGTDNPYLERLSSICSEFGPENPRKPFEFWKPVDPDFKDLVLRMTKLDPARRITAREALEHPWFA